MTSSVFISVSVGGGKLNLLVGGILTIASGGVLAVNGGFGTCHRDAQYAPPVDCAGSGSGGSINIVATTLDMAGSGGSVQANGGSPLENPNVMGPSPLESGLTRGAGGSGMCKSGIPPSQCQRVC